MRKISILLFTLHIVGFPSLASGQTTRAETIGPARVAITPVCPSSSKPGVGPSREFAGIGAAALSFVGGIGVDLFRSGLNAAATALEEASRERAIGGQGTANFAFYSLAVAGNRVDLSNRLRTGNVACLLISIDATPDAAPSPIADQLPQIAATTRLGGENSRRAIYVEAVLRTNGDSFVVLPNYIWIGQRLHGIPNSPVPAELQVQFSVPGVTENGGDVFAIARIRLPAMGVNQVYLPAMLEGYSSGALPLRPTAGLVDSVKQAAETLYTSILTDQRAIEAERRSQRYAEEDLRNMTQPTDAARAAVLQHARQIETLNERIGNSRADAELIVRENSPKNVGSTNVTARIAFIRRPNRFGLAIAEALRSRAPTAATSLETAINSQITRSEWSADETNYVSAMGRVRVAQLAYDNAMAATDINAQRTALGALQDAQAGANAAAAALHRGLPFPQLLHQLRP